MGRFDAPPPRVDHSGDPGFSSHPVHLYFYISNLVLYVDQKRVMMLYLDMNVPTWYH
jgi:hypothetical protein